MDHLPSREEELFHAARELPASERGAYLQKACAGDETLRQRIEALLRANHEAGTVLSTEAPVTEKAGDRIERYRLLQEIGEGGCGVVYMAEQQEPVRRRVALKIIKLGMDTRQVVARFEAERQALAMMDHPNIAKVLDAGVTETGRPFFVMELVRGVPITEYCDTNNLSTRERLELFVPVCKAIQHAHQKGIIHRDIKPSNILVTLHDGTPVPKVIDFGIAKAIDQPLTEKTLFTRFEQFMGTPAYMSPEQAEMSGLDIDTRSDIYSLGVLLYELLTGRTPFDSKELLASGLDAMRKTIREKEPVRPSTRLATLQGEELTTTARRRSADTAKLMHLLRGDLDWIVMRCLEKDRTRRYETANGLAADINRHLNNEPVIARPPSTAYKFQKAFRRNKLVFAAGTAIALALMLGVIGTTIGLLRARHSEAIAMQSRNDAEKLSNFMLEDLYTQLEPSGRFETIVEMAKHVVAYYDSLPPSSRTPHTERNRAMARARLAMILVQQGKFKDGLAIARDVETRLEQMRARGDQQEQTAYALALALHAQSFYAFATAADAETTRNLLQRKADILRPYVISGEATRATKFSYVNALNYLSHVQKAEQGVAACDEALRVLAGMGRLDGSDVDVAAAWVDVADSRGREMIPLGRLDEAEQSEREGLKLSQTILAQNPSDLRARRDLDYAVNLLGLIEAIRFHDAAAMDWFTQDRKACEDIARLNPSEEMAWVGVARTYYFISCVQLRNGKVAEGLETASAGIQIENDHTHYEDIWGGLLTTVAVWEAQRGNRVAAETLLQKSRQFLDEKTKAGGLAEHMHDRWNVAIDDAERQIKAAFGEDAIVLRSANEATIRIEHLAAGVDDMDTSGLLNQLKRRALSEAAIAAMKLNRYPEAETAAHSLVAMPLLRSEEMVIMTLSQPDDFGWGNVLLAQAQVAQGRSAEALKTLEPALELYRQMQAQGVIHLTFRQRYARALYVQALAQADNTSGIAQRRASLTEAAMLLNDLSDDARQLHNTKELLSWITAAQNKLNPDAQQP
jgi:serine/threonine protein kinase